MGNTERRFSLRSETPLVVAHRGASATHPENTLAAFEAAITAGAEFVEFDVRITSDGVPVVMHDADVSRTTDGSGLVRELTLEQVKRLTVRGAGPAAAVPTLRETFDALDGRVGADVEIKNLPMDADYEPDGEPSVDATLREASASGFSSPLVISSFSLRSIRRAKAAAPEVPTGLLVIDTLPCSEALEIVVADGHSFVLPSADAVEREGVSFLSRAHDQGVRVAAWTVDNPGRAAALFRLGIDALATNDPAAIVPIRDAETQ